MTTVTISARLRSELESQAGYCNARDDLRHYLTQAILGYDGSLLEPDGEELAVINVLDDESESEFNAENIRCAVLEIDPVDDSEPIIIGYYSDGAQHALDILDGEDTVEDWAKLWDRDGLLPCYLWGTDDTDES